MEKKRPTLEDIKTNEIYTGNELNLLIPLTIMAIIAMVIILFFTIFNL